jgi:hypothetical protein
MLFGGLLAQTLPPPPTKVIDVKSLRLLDICGPVARVSDDAGDSAALYRRVQLRRRLIESFGCFLTGALRGHMRNYGPGFRDALQL